MDLRKPIGYLFTVLGVLLSIYGLLGEKTPMTSGGMLDRQGQNINLYWGVVMLVFGVVMWIFAKKAGDDSSDV